MSRNSFCLALALALLAGSLAWACGPDFPFQLLDDRSQTLKQTPANTFAFEMMHLAPKPARTFPVEEGSAWKSSSDVSEHEAASLAPAAHDAVKRMRGAASGEEALRLGSGLDEDVKLYTAGAVDFHAEDYAAAIRRFQAVLALAADRRPHRAVWAAFMLGRTSDKLGDREAAAKAFMLTRELAVAGGFDPEGLASASFGEEARLHLQAAETITDEDENLSTPESALRFAGEIAKAVSLYAEQAAQGSQSGVSSLRVVAQALLAEPNWMTAAVGEPLVQRLLVAYVLARVGDLVEDRQDLSPDDKPRPPVTTLNPLVTSLVEAIERRGLAQVASADRLAALAYRAGRYDLAGQLAEKTQGPIAAWIKAKLALQKGDLTGAAGFYAEAARGFTPEDVDDGSRNRIVGEQGVVALARSDYRSALEILYPLARTYWGDVAYIAERVLTLDELKRFVDAGHPPFPELKPRGEDEYDETVILAKDAAQSLRYLLARRLMRAGRGEEALAYYPEKGPEEQEILLDARRYLAALKAAKSSWWAADRARGWFEAASLARYSGMEIMGYEGPPDVLAVGGEFYFGAGQATAEGDYVTEDEQKRFAASAARPDRRFHYRYIAANHAVEAANLVPPRSQAFAAVLCKATGWMLGSQRSYYYDDERNEALNQEPLNRAQAYYARYVKEGPLVPWATHFGHDCPAPDFDAAAHMAKIQVYLDARSFWRGHRREVVFGGLGILLIGAALVGARLFRRKAA